MLEQLERSIRQSLSRYAELETEAPLKDAAEHLELHLLRVRLWVMRHMRRYADRLFKADGTYSDRCVGPQEFARLMGFEPQLTEGEVWLDDLGVPTLEEVGEHLARVEAALEARLQATLAAGLEGRLPIEVVRRGFALAPEELDLLLAAAAPRLSTDLSRLYAVAWSDYSVRQPTAGFICELIAPDEAEVDRLMRRLTARQTLLAADLTHLVDNPRWQPTTPRLHALVVVPQRVLDHLAGVGLHDAEVDGAVLHNSALRPQETVIPRSLYTAVVSGLERPQARVLLIGSSSSGRCTVVRSVAAAQDRRVMEVDLGQALSGKPQAAVMGTLHALLREARLLQAVLYLNLDSFDLDEINRQMGGRASAIRDTLAAYNGSIFIATRDLSHNLHRLFDDLVEVEVNAPDHEGQLLLWRMALRGATTDERVEALSNQLSLSYRLPSGLIFRAVQTAQAYARAAARDLGGGAGDSTEGAELEPDHILKAIRQLLDHKLGALADPVHVQMTLDQVVLTDDNRHAVDEVLAFARHSPYVFKQWRFGEKSPTGKGLSVLFSGPPGTGKTLVAGVIAHELGRFLYRIDLSQVVDKYIGETEKNLGRVFDEAERAQAILLFDEADSLFSKRTDVKSSNDRYANLEVNYLLQRLDEFTGVSILTTNHPQSIDDAFQRRIRFKVEFPMPDRDMRADLWKRLLPPAAPIDEAIDWELLAEDFEYSGGHIRNAILRASVRAAARGHGITEELLYDAAVDESRELGQLVRRYE